MLLNAKYSTYKYSLHIVEMLTKDSLENEACFPSQHLTQQIFDNWRKNAHSSDKLRTA